MLTHASIFSGIGGPEVAAAMLGWENLFHCEIQDFPRKVLEFHFPESKSYKDVTKTDFTEWRGKVDVLSGGFPCQPFSYAGKRRGADDPRYLWPQMCRVIKEVQPTWVVCENVYGIATMAFPSSPTKVGSQSSMFGEIDYMERRERFVIDEICEQFENNGYSVIPFVVPAVAVGAHHLRNRIFFVANSNSERSRFRALQELERLKQPRNVVATSNNGTSADSDSIGCCAQRTDRRERQTLDSERQNESFVGLGGLGEKQTLADSTSERGRQGKHYIQSELANGAEPERNGSKWDAIQSTERWQNFPSVSPIYGGTNGFPFDVDSLSVPFAKWRKESLKAYGNAIVPQVIYEIFWTIQQTYGRN